MVPIQKIIDYLGWGDFFTGIYALDTCTEAQNKFESIGYIMQQHQLLPSQSVYVGDMVPDRIASRNNKLPFVMVSWGYEFKVASDDDFVESSDELYLLLNDICSK